jgi:flagellar biosynthesis component FlhA
MLTDAVRVALARAICKQYVDANDRLFCLMLDPHLEEVIAGHLEHADGVVGSSINTMPPGQQQRIGQEIVDHAEAAGARRAFRGRAHVAGGSAGR